MKFLLYRVKRRRSNNRRTAAFNIERILFVAFVTTFVAMIIVQAVLMNPAVGTSLSINEEFEGAPLKAEEFLYAEGRLVLQLIEGVEDYNLKVLVNGDEAARFSDKNVEITVRDGDVIEIDGSDVENHARVAIVYKSDNILSDCVNKAVSVNSNIRRLVKVRIK